jgi:hypothetical protein
MRLLLAVISRPLTETKKVKTPILIFRKKIIATIKGFNYAKVIQNNNKVVNNLLDL